MYALEICVCKNKLNNHYIKYSEQTTHVGKEKKPQNLWVTDNDFVRKNTNFEPSLLNNIALGTFCSIISSVSDLGWNKKNKKTYLDLSIEHICIMLENKRCRKRAARLTMHSTSYYCSNHRLLW